MKVPEGWSYSKLAVVSKTVMGFAFKSNDFVERGMPLVRMGNLYQNKLQLDRNPVFFTIELCRTVFYLSLKIRRFGHVHDRDNGQERLWIYSKDT